MESGNQFMQVSGLGNYVIGSRKEEWQFEIGLVIVTNKLQFFL